jgi:hypothetical protein
MLPQDGIVEADDYHNALNCTLERRRCRKSNFTLDFIGDFKEIDDDRQLCETVRAIMWGRHRKYVNIDESKHSK